MKISYHYPLMLAMVAALGLLWTSAAPPADAHPDFGCHSCHTPHNGNNTEVPLWNPDHTTSTMEADTPYDSDTMDATVSTINGSSVLCLSCHDGSYPHVSDEHSFGDANALGGLQTSHPISFVYDTALATADGELVDPTTLAGDILDDQSRMQCTSCHDVHGTTATETLNLRWEYNTSSYGSTAAFCRNCHNAK